MYRYTTVLVVALVTQDSDMAFAEVQNSHNPANSQVFLGQFPYHLGALMSMVDLYTAYGAPNACMMPLVLE